MRRLRPIHAHQHQRRHERDGGEGIRGHPFRLAIRLRQGQHGYAGGQTREDAPEPRPGWFAHLRKCVIDPTRRQGE